MNENKKRNWIETTYYSMGCFLEFSGFITALVVGAVIFLCVLEWIFPEGIHLINYSLSTRTFTELKAANHYKAATDFFELKQELLINSDEAFQNITEACDCYIKTGYYEKAEKYLKELFDLKYIPARDSSHKFKIDGIDIDAFFKMLKLDYAKELFDLYDVMGDRDNMEKYAVIIDDLLENDFTNMDSLITEFDDMPYCPFSSMRRFYRIKIDHFNNPDKALDDLGDYITEIMLNENYGAHYVLKCMNLYISWSLELDGILPTCQTIAVAARYAFDNISSFRDYAQFGPLSDYCYMIHDTLMSRTFQRELSNHMSGAKYEEDYVYIENKVRGFKFLEIDGEWNKLYEEVEDCCESLKSLITKNFTLMSESQREYFVKILETPFGYASDLLYRHPSDRLARLCLNNSIFMKGLLLRSNRDMRNRIASTGNDTLLHKYEKLQQLKMEYGIRENLGMIGNRIVKIQLKDSINALDKELMAESDAFNKEMAKEPVTAETILGTLPDSLAIIDFQETKAGNMYAIILKDKITFIPIGNRQTISETFQGDIGRIYSDTTVTNLIWGKIENELCRVSNVYYTVGGLFNEISFPTLYSGNGKHLIDRYNFHLLSNIANIVNYQNEALSKNSAALWGGIDYGEAPEGTALYRGGPVTRGTALLSLPFSGDEVRNIDSIMHQAGSKTTLYSIQNATEESFKSRSGKKDNILHISTHGFFEEDQSHTRTYNPMYNSGLFFAGANRVWCNNNSYADSLSEDGILRSDEIQYLDFSDCSLAVLSACRTGLGRSSTSEGVYGLQRAFKLAGVRKILMSLWNVDDRCTSEMMSLFYDGITKGMTEDDALQNAINIVRTEYPSPEYWGAFVLLN